MSELVPWRVVGFGSINKAFDKPEKWWNRVDSGAVSGTKAIKTLAGRNGCGCQGNGSCCGISADGQGGKVTPFWQTRPWVVLKQWDFATPVIQIRPEVKEGPVRTIHHPRAPNSNHCTHSGHT